MKTLLVLLITISLFGCQKNNTTFFEDAEKNGLSIFSNKGNNLLSCYVNNTAWLTRSRISSSAYTYYEMGIGKQKTGAIKDTLIFTWNFAANYTDDYKVISLRIAVDSSFTYKDFKNVFNNKRIVIDSTVNGYFKTSINSTLVNGRVPATKGNGVIFFQAASINILAYKGDENIISGLLSAKIGTNVITDGRFDHDLNGLPIGF